MTKPNDFIFNSDYLALAQTNKKDLTAFFPAETFSAGVAHDRTQDFDVSSSQGAIDTCLISINDDDYRLAQRRVISTSPALVQITVFRTTPQTIRVRLHVFTNQSGGYSMPAQTVKIKVCSFKPPDVF